MRRSARWDSSVPIVEVGELDALEGRLPLGTLTGMFEPSTVTYSYSTSPAGALTASALGGAAQLPSRQHIANPPCSPLPHRIPVKSDRHPPEAD